MAAGRLAFAHAQAGQGRPVGRAWPRGGCLAIKGIFVAMKGDFIAMKGTDRDSLRADRAALSP